MNKLHTNIPLNPPHPQSCSTGTNNCTTMYTVYEYTAALNLLHDCLFVVQIFRFLEDELQISYDKKFLRIDVSWCEFLQQSSNK